MRLLSSSKHKACNLEDAEMNWNQDNAFSNILFLSFISIEEGKLKWYNKIANIHQTKHVMCQGQF
jgi:hypothetical protein